MRNQIKIFAQNTKNDYFENQGSNLKEFTEAWCARRKSAINSKEKCYALKIVIEYIKKCL